MIFVLCFPAEQRQSNQNALLPSTGISRWCWLSAWMLQEWMLSKCLEGCIPVKAILCPRMAYKFHIATHDLFKKRFQQAKPVVQHHYRFVQLPGQCNNCWAWGKGSEQLDKATFSALLQAILQVTDKSSEGSRNTSWLSGPQSSPACCGTARTVQSYSMSHFHRYPHLWCICDLRSDAAFLLHTYLDRLPCMTHLFLHHLAAHGHFSQWLLTIYTCKLERS